MAVSQVSSTSTQATSSTGSTTRKVNSELGKDDFLNLLVTQLRYQDPMSPMEDKEFIGQMAQFSSLEQMQNMSKGFSTLKSINMIDKYIQGTIKDTESSDIEVVTGKVEDVKISGGNCYVVVDGKDVNVDSVTKVSSSEISEE